MEKPLDKPTVSVIVITYNRKELLTETIHSILNQTYQDFEVIVVDNYSNYNFFDLIKSFNSDKIYGYQVHNNGVIAVSRNVGIGQAKGKYLAFCDDDDLWLPQKLEKQVPLLESGNYDIIGTSITMFGECIDGEKNIVQKYKSTLDPFMGNKLTPSTVITVNSQDVRFNENPYFNCSEDWTLWLSLLLKGFRLYQIEEPLIMYRVFSQNLTKKNKRQPDVKAIRILWYLYKKNKNSFKLSYLLIATWYHAIKAVLRSVGILTMLKK